MVVDRDQVVVEASACGGEGNSCYLIVSFTINSKHYGRSLPQCNVINRLSEEKLREKSR